MKCKVCDKETNSERKQTCSPRCRKAFSRQSVTESVTLLDKSVTNVTENKESVTAEQSSNIPLKFFYAINEKNYNKDPLKRITEVPYIVDSSWYKSIDFANLIEELEVKSIKQLEKEGYFIPAWKHSGCKTNPINNLKVCL